MDLQPGDQLKLGDNVGTYIGRVTPHPLYSTLWMIIWWLQPEGMYSFDALSPLQHLTDELLPNDIFSRKANLQRILTPGVIRG